ncbi:hypothetical protein H072_8074 [Dactylellina haptotyla CBS 200.50]|uniref:F-box domain-containing protein n=1 Tax=Dactylellina haptotyla (strain CBS 200.50) TaxID=1284197 RepID=S8A5E5_DACHA|nr:hypothetical protein H072_8074 [Dactylellina haptotyla CBS 200.50]
MASEMLETPNSLSPFLNLPFDILFGIVNYLSFRDIIALSLTAKGLRGLCPPRPSVGEQKAICFSHIQHGYLAKPVIPSQPHKCPYCRVPICPPTCRTAVILDSDSGFCFPRNLFPVHLAIFKYADTTHGNRHNFQTFPPRRRPSTTEYPYSTIWCEHHRCPKDLLANEKYYNIENGMGATLFVREYEWWRQNKVLCHEVDVGYWIHDRWTVGYKKPLTLNARFRNLGLHTSPFVPKYSEFAEDEIEDVLDDTDNNNDDDLAPIHEKFYYDKMCLHCLSAVPRISPRKDFRQGNFLAYLCECIDEASVTSLAQPNVAVNPWITPARLTRKAVRSRGCLNCGTASVKFTRIEAFDFVEDNECDRLTARGKGLRREGFWVYLATKCQIGYDICPTAVEKERLYPVDPEQHSELSDIVRGETEEFMAGQRSYVHRKLDFETQRINRIAGIAIAIFVTITSAEIAWSSLDVFDILLHSKEDRELWAALTMEIKFIRDWYINYGPITRDPDHKYPAWLKPWDELAVDALKIIEDVRVKFEPVDTDTEEFTYALAILEGKFKIDSELDAVTILDTLDGYLQDVPKWVKGVVNLVKGVQSYQVNPYSVIFWFFDGSLVRGTSGGDTMVSWQTSRPGDIRKLLLHSKLEFGWAGAEFQTQQEFLRTFSEDFDYPDLITLETLTTYCTYYSEKLRAMFEIVDRIRKSDAFKSLYEVSGFPLPRDLERFYNQYRNMPPAQRRITLARDIVTLSDAEEVRAVADTIFSSNDAS